jgi:HD superfamily phosphohydrolase
MASGGDIVGLAGPKELRPPVTCLFNDDVHQLMELQPLTKRILNTHEFSRLKDLKQLGGAYSVFPGASHNRFEHSLGVAHLARTFVEELAARHPSAHVTKEDMLCVEIAGLIHDLGHGIMSHMFDSKYIPAKLGTGIGWEHEHASVDMFDHLITVNNLQPFFRDAGLDPVVDKRFIQELVLGGPDSGHPNFADFKGCPHRSAAPAGTPNRKRFLYEIVANKRNGIDVDKWDYFLRDASRLGLTTAFNAATVQRLIRHARVMTVEGESGGDPCTQIGYHVKMGKEVYSLFRARFQLHDTAYQHKTARCIEYMYSEALIAAGDHFTVPGTGGVPRRMHEAISDMAAYNRMSDYVLKQLENSNDAHPGMVRAREILKNIHRRKLYTFLMEATIPPTYVGDAKAGEGAALRVLTSISFIGSQLGEAVDHATEELRKCGAAVALPTGVKLPGSAARFRFGNGADHSEPPPPFDGASFEPTLASVDPVVSTNGSGTQLLGSSQVAGGERRDRAPLPKAPLPPAAGKGGKGMVQASMTAFLGGGAGGAQAKSGTQSAFADASVPTRAPKRGIAVVKEGAGAGAGGGSKRQKREEEPTGDSTQGGAAATQHRRSHRGLQESDRQWIVQWLVAFAGGMPQEMVDEARASYTKAKAAEEEAHLAEGDVDVSASQSGLHYVPLSQMPASQGEDITLSQASQGSGGGGGDVSHATTSRSEVLCAEDIFVDLVRLDYGSKDKDPVENITFFQINKGDGNAFPCKLNRKDMGPIRVPSVFQQQCIRLYSKRNAVDHLAQAAFYWFTRAVDLNMTLSTYFKEPERRRRNKSRPAPSVGDAGGAAGRPAQPAQAHAVPQLLASQYIF